MTSSWSRALRLGDDVQGVGNAPIVSVVIPVRNEAAFIDRCLRSIVVQDIGVDAVEILVVDGGSTDDTRDRVRAWISEVPFVRLMDNPSRITPAALNIGIRAATGSVIARMDGHSEAPPDYLSRGLMDLTQTGAWAVGGQMRRVGTTPTTDAIAAATMSPFGVGDAAHNFATEPMWAETVFLGMWPRWVFERVGLFDEELVRNQDDEFSYRIREAGGRILFDPVISMSYQPRASYGALFDQYRQYGMWKVRVFQMHPRSLRPRHWVPMMWVGYLVVTAAASLFLRPAAILFAFGVVSYLAVMLAAAARMRRGIDHAGRVLSAFLALHLGYGFGSWQGAIRFAPRWFVRRKGSPPRIHDAEAAMAKVSPS